MRVQQGARPKHPIAVRLAAGLGLMLVLTTGIIGWGRTAESAGTAMLLTGAWFAIVLIGAALVARRHPSLWLPLAAGYAAVSVAATILLVLPMLRDDVVDEQVVAGGPVAAAGTAAAAETNTAAAAEANTGAAADAGTGAASSGNVELASGDFQAIAHAGSGVAAVVELANGRRMLTLTDFETDNGPDLRVYLTTEDPAAGGELGDVEDLGGLKGNQGSQQYEIPAGLDVGRFSTAVIYCRAFSVSFTSARMAAG